MAEIPSYYDCEECGDEMEEVTEGEFQCLTCGAGIIFYIEDGELYGDTF